MFLLEPPLDIAPRELIGRLVTDPLRPLETTLFGPAVRAGSDAPRGWLLRLLCGISPAVDWPAIKANFDIPAYVRANQCVYLVTDATAAGIECIIFASRDAETERDKRGRTFYVEDMARRVSPARRFLALCGLAPFALVGVAVVLVLLWIWLSGFAMSALAVAYAVVLVAKLAEALFGPSAFTVAVLAAFDAVQTRFSGSCGTGACNFFAWTSMIMGVSGLIMHAMKAIALAQSLLRKGAEPQDDVHKQGVELV